MFGKCRKKTFVLVLIFHVLLSCPLFAGEDKKTGNGRIAADIMPETLLPPMTEGPLRHYALAVAPAEIDFGKVGSDNVVNRLLSLRNLDAGALRWSFSGPEGWEASEEQELAGLLASEPYYISLSLRTIRRTLPENAFNAGRRTYTVQLKVAAGSNVLSFRRDLPAGAYREPLFINHEEGTGMVFLNFTVTDGKTRPLLNVEPPRVDFEVLTPGKQATKQIRITNRGRDTVSWRIIAPKPGDERANPPAIRGRFISFLNDENRGSAAYLPSGHLKEYLEISGEWSSHDGYPSAVGMNNLLSCRFSGTGASLHLRHGPDMGKIAVFVDGRLVLIYDGAAPERGREELPVAEGMPDGPHVLSLTILEGRAIVEGMTVHGKEPTRAGHGWLSVVPDSGTTTRETDYVNIRMDAQQMPPGIYGGPLLIVSSAGNVILEAHAEIRSDQTPKFIDVYRYARNGDYLYSANPQADLSRPQNRGFKKEGIAFRLFAPGAPGTTEFYRWYNGTTGDYYYSYDLQGGGKNLRGYVFEGAIGNIGTSRLSNTKELYRWYSQKTRCHFYTTDQKGEGMAGKGYKFDGIAGYVR